MANPELTAGQIKFLDETNADRAAAEKTLRIALNFHANQTAFLEKRLIGFWDELLDTHKLDRSIKWMTKSANGTMQIIPCPGEEIERED